MMGYMDLGRRLPDVYIQVEKSSGQGLPKSGSAQGAKVSWDFLSFLKSPKKQEGPGK